MKHEDAHMVSYFIVQAQNNFDAYSLAVEDDIRAFHSKTAHYALTLARTILTDRS